MLDNEADRTLAQNILQPADANTTVVQREFATPEEWIAGALTGESGGLRVHYLDSSLRGWSPAQLNELTTRFQELPAEQRDRIAQFVVESSYSINRNAPALAGEAVRHLLTAEPTGAEDERQARQLTQLASSNAVRWVLQDAEAASAWVNSLPAGDAKLWAQKNMAANWANYDPEAAAQWVQSLPAEARDDVHAFMNGNSEP
jgi:hypothetical protein